MSTPSGKPLNPIDPSASVSHETHERAGAERHPVENGHDHVRSPYAPKKARTQPAVEEDSASSPHQEQPAAVRCDEIIRDLERLAASVRWVQREEAAARVPRAAQLSSVSGLAPVDAKGRGHSGEMFDNGFWAPRSLEPERLAPPPAMRSRRGNLRGPLSI